MNTALVFFICLGLFIGSIIITVLTLKNIIKNTTVDSLEESLNNGKFPGSDKVSIYIGLLAGVVLCGLGVLISGIAWIVQTLAK